MSRRPSFLAPTLVLLAVVAALRAQEPSTFRLSVDEVQARAGDKGVAAVIRLTTPSPYEGYSVVLGYDRNLLFPTGVDLIGTVTDRSFVEFSNMERYPRYSVVTFDVLTEFGAPFEGKTLPAGEQVVLCKLLFDVLDTAAIGESAFTFPREVGDLALTSSILVEGVRHSLEGTPAVLAILPPKPPPSANLLTLTSSTVDAGQEGDLQVLASLTGQLEAYTVIVGFDPAVMQVTAMDLAGSRAEALAPEMTAPRIENEAGFAVMTVIFDFLPPLDRRTLPPGEEVLLLTIRFRAAASAAPGPHRVELRNEVGQPPLNNIFVFGAQSYLPELTSGEVVIRDQAPTFIRGDYDASQLVDLADPILLVNHLFQGGPSGACDDAGDADDTGLLDLSDAIQILNHLFQGAAPLPPPNPDPGSDPSSDELECHGGAAP